MLGIRRDVGIELLCGFIRDPQDVHALLTVIDKTQSTGLGARCLR